MTRIVLLALVLAATACSEKEDLSDVRAELIDLRAEQRAQREELRELRDLVRKPAEPQANEPAEGEAPASDQPGAPAASAPATSPAASAPSAAGKPVGKPPAQGSVNIQVESNPDGASVFVAEKKVGVTPVVIKTPVGSEEIRVRLEKSGYRPRLMTLKPEEDTKISVQLAKKAK